jgi:hypothetical protein
LWVEDENYNDAAFLMAEWHNPTVTGAPWVCSRCGEKLEPQFSKCWKCGTRKDAAPLARAGGSSGFSFFQMRKGTGAFTRAR